MDESTIREAHSACDELCDVAPLLAIIDQLRAELAETKSSRDGWHVQACKDARDGAQLRIEVSGLKAQAAKDADVMRICEALLSYNGGEAALLEQLRELREAAEAVQQGRTFVQQGHRIWYEVPKEQMQALDAVLAKGRQ